MLAASTSRQIDEHGAENVSVYGDSAGSNVAIAAVEQLVLAGSAVSNRMVLLSLTPDTSLFNPDIADTDDPVTDVNHLGDYSSAHWADGLDDRKSPYLNALYFRILAGLPPINSQAPFVRLDVYRQLGLIVGD